MSPTPSWRRYLRFWRADPEADLDDELRFHLEMRRADYRAEGLDPSLADEATLRRFGDVERVRDACRDIDRRWAREQRLREWFESVAQDARYAVRQLARAPGFTIVAALTLALGIGANGAVFSLVDRVLLRPVPEVREPERLVQLSRPGVSYPSYRDFRDGAAPMASLAAFANRFVSLGVGERSELAAAGTVTGNYFSVLGVRAALGRMLVPDDERPGAPPVAVLSDLAWRRHFDADPAVVGRTVRLNGSPMTIVGVAPSGFRGTRISEPPAVWITIPAWWSIAPSSFAGLGLEKRSWSWLTVVGRPRPGKTVPQLQAALAASANWQEEHHRNETRTGYARSLKLETGAAAAIAGGAYRSVVQFAAVLLGVVGIVLLIACANVANLLLARAASRRREVAVRLALGAGRRRIVRQLLTETLVLAAIAGAIALGITQAIAMALGGVRLGGYLPLGALGLGADGRVVAITALIALAAGVLFGLAPALHGTRLGVAMALRDGTQGENRSRTRTRGVLLVAQLALSLVLLVGAGLLGRSLRRALATDVGFDGGRVAVATADVGLAHYDSTRARRYYDDALERVRRAPGVLDAAWATALPLYNGQDTESYSVVGEPPAADEQPETEVGTVGADYFRVFGIRIVAGRAFSPSDDAHAPHVAIVNETMARRHFGGAALGRRIAFSRDTATIVGVAHDIAYHELREKPRPFVYRVMAQRIASDGLGPVSLAVRSAGEPSLVEGVIARALADVGHDVPAYDFGSFEDRSGHAVLAQRAGASLLGVFGLLALAIATVGAYGVVAFAVGQRTREIGIRMALGARAGDVVRMVLAESLRYVVAGIVLGLALAAVASRALAAFLVDVSPTDAATYAAMSLALVAAGLVAALVPARRASRIDPARTLKAE
jgi:predicted permease